VNSETDGTGEDMTDLEDFVLFAVSCGLCELAIALYEVQSKFPEFFDIDGSVHHEFVTPRQTVTGHFYVHICRGCNAGRRKQFYKWQGQWFLHHDNTPSHTSLVVQQFLSETNISVVTQKQYYSDLAPTDFQLFPIPKMGLKGTRFVAMEDIKSNAMAKLRKISKEDFRPCFQR
jgi:hypothetical protein